MLLAPEQVGRRFVAAFDVANTTAIDYLDRHAAVARRRGQVVSTEGLVGASYFHATSRALDPHPHRHNVIANAVVDDEGDIRALDARALYRAGPAAAALATAAARWELRDLGLGWWQRDNGIWEIAGVDESSDRGVLVTSPRDRRDQSGTRAATWPPGHTPPRTHGSGPTPELTRPPSTRSSCRSRGGIGPIGSASMSPPASIGPIGRSPSTPFRTIGSPPCSPTWPTASTDCAPASTDSPAATSSPRSSTGLWRTSTARRRKVLLPVAEIETLADRFLACDHVIALDPSTRPRRDPPP